MPAHRVELEKLQASSNEVSHRELCWLIRATVEWKNPDAKHGVHNAIRNALKVVSKRREFSGVPLPESVLDDWVSKPPANLREMLPLAVALFDHVIAEVPSGAHPELLSRARAYAQHQLNPAERRLRLWSRVLGLDNSPPQEWSKTGVGDYLILRRLMVGSRLLVSHMKITAGAGPNDPAEFVTNRAAATFSGEQGDRIVRGIVYEAPTAEGAIFTIGKIADSPEIRSTILRFVPKPVRNSNEYPLDLQGIRLGLGPGLKQPFRMPAAYRIWCARLPERAPEGGWLHFATDYSITGRPAFAKYVPGFSAIMRWLNEPSGAMVESVKTRRIKARTRKGPKRAAKRGRK